MTKLNFILALAACAFAAAWGISLVQDGQAKVQAQTAALSHECVAPCVVKFAPNTQEDEVAWDFEGAAKSTVRVTRACDHYCFEALTQSGADLCADFKILPVLTERGDRWPNTLRCA